VIESIIVSFVAGVLTAAAPCILPFLPIVIGGSVAHGGMPGERSSLRHPLTIIASLSVSIVLSTLLLKATTLFLGVPTSVWAFVSGGIIVLFGLTMIVPSLWENSMTWTGWQAGANRLMARSQQNKGITRDVLLGMALGPVFNSCSPTYALIVAVILPVSFATGVIYLAAYVVGLALILLLISLAGRAVVEKLRWLSNPGGIFKKALGGMFIVVGCAIIFGVDRHVQTYVLEQGWYDPIMRVEESFRR
jgi:cytochrome c biogenesis protein CcdA